MKLESTSLTDGQPIPPQYAFAVPATEGHVSLSDNLNPQLAWSDAPAATKSFVVVVHDPDVPSVGDDVNQEGKQVPADLPRVDFYHWLLWNIPADVTELAEGSHCGGITAKGKSGPDAPAGYVHGLNDYTGWFAGDADMGGDYYGYDGPCPPWNDSIIHHYHFTVYALDVATLELGAGVNGAGLLVAIEGHVLDQASLVGTYTLNPELL
ncbi:YbhB/YbcL family Raf kinase inhibitor-like protein [Oceanobacter mangrovi]|uniref:YbhB/YbcL family Raf kinase inhibitor-like protein n=1 Tax=Oceanobacter mangrovi TaxID=2862510 RepID=UPI001C8DFD60|nr:YbhB/YbcL family Raf kinase inhibitor-like protein [Oceanobacter mangrovi]